MKKNFQLMLLMLVFLVNSAFADSTTVKIFERNIIHFGGGVKNDTSICIESDNGRIVSKKIVLPEFDNPVRIYADLDIDTNGDPWDMAGSVYLSGANSNNIELLKFITPYGAQAVLRNDVTNLASELKGEVTINAFVDTWSKDGWIFDFSLVFVEEDTISTPGWAYGVMNNQFLTKKTVTAAKPTFNVNIPPKTERVLLTYYTSGHCTDGRGADEFSSKNNIIEIDGNEILNYRPWRDDCANFPSHGNYWYSRSGWCPGDKVYPVILDVTEELTSGVHDISYWIDNIRGKGWDGHQGYWRVSSYLTGWGDISEWIPSKIILTGPNEDKFPTETSITLRVDLVDQNDYTIFKTNEIIEFTANNAGAFFSTDGTNWKNRLQVNVAHGTTSVLFKSTVEGEVAVSVKDVDSNPIMQTSEKLTFNFSDFSPNGNKDDFALKFDGTNDYVNMGNDSSLRITGNELTLEAMVKVNKFKDQVWAGCVLTKDENSSGHSDCGYMIRIGGPGIINFNIGNNGWNEIETPAYTLSENTWYHISAVNDGSTMKIYVNGELIKSKNKTVSVGDAANKPLLIGDSPQWPGRVFDGIINECRVWNVARTQEQIKETMNDTLAAAYYSTADSGLVGYWKFDEGEGQFTNDLTLNNNNGVLGNSVNTDPSDPAWIKANYITSVSNNEPEIIESFVLKQNYPNPFNGTTIVNLELATVTKVDAVVLNVAGQVVKRLLNGQLPKGEHLIRWNGDNMSGKSVSSGVYFLNVRFTESSGNSSHKSIKMIYVK